MDNKYMTNYERVVDFMMKFGQKVKTKPSLGNYELQDLRKDLIDEEVWELSEALHRHDIVGVADALTDILYVVYGAGAAFGINLDETFREVHRSNMSKLGPDGKPIYREDGKVLKGPNYSPPNLEDIVRGKL